RVFDREGKRVDQGRPATHPGGDHSSVALPLPPLPDGSYVVTWRVVSADSHPIHGAFTFRVGEGGTGPEATPGELAQTGGSRLVGVLYAAVRTLVFLSLLVLVGGVAFLLLLWPEGWSDRRAVRVLWAALLTAFVSTVLGVGLQAAYGAGLPLADAFKPSLVRPVLGNRIGRVWLARLVLLTGADVALTAFARRRPGAVGKALFAVLGLALLATPGLAGHAASGDLVPLAVPVDTLHLAAAALWLGGLALLLARVLPGDPEAAARIVPRFSRVAFASVVVLVLTGSFQSWRQVRELDALTATTYGRTLLVKVGLFAGLVALAGVSRLLVRRRNLAPLRTTVLAEAAVAVAVLVATSMLVSAVPARSALAQPVTKELTAGPLVVDVTVDPAKQGPATIHLYTLSPTGQVAEVQEATVQLRLPEKGVGPLDVPLQRAGPGHFAAYGFDIPLSGPWRFDVSVRTTDIDVYRAAATIRIR
ncbi:MAG TPA: CopD family protein, partial [Acidimicrobiales bacterium]|nr:CopD family protein [Acidimicrobiales bacterium]